MFSLFLLTAFGESSTARRLASRDDRRRLTASSLGLENVECHEDAVTFELETGEWNDYAGHFKFDAPYVLKDHIYVLEADSGTWPTYSANEPCWDCTASTAPKKTSALVLEPPQWTDNWATLDLYVNFKDSAPKSSSFKLYFCWHIPSFELYWEPDSGHYNLSATVTAIAGFLAQGSWETGKWAACDEENHTGWKTAACTQKEKPNVSPAEQDLDQYYHELDSSPHACTVTSTMSEKGTTDASKTLDGDTFELADGTWKGLECKEDTDTEKCCWWGRGAIQLTGPSNYGNLQHDIIENSDSLKNKVDLCARPGDICNSDYPSMKFVSGLYYWVTAVQTDSCFNNTLEAYLKDYDIEATANDDDHNACVAFAYGIGGQVNMGSWNDDHVHGQSETTNGVTDGRVPRFKTYMAAIKTALATYKTDGAKANPTDCTGNKAVDTIFDNAGLKTLVGLGASGIVYTWDGFCDALKEFGVAA